MIAKLNLFAAARVMVAAVTFSVVAVSSASAYIGPSFMQVPGIAGGWQGEQYKGWIRVEANYWRRNPIVPPIRNLDSSLLFTVPNAPREGANMLAISIDKHSPAFKVLMDQCVAGTKLPEVTFAESTDLARHTQEDGPRPADIPAYFEYKLKDVQLNCPVIADAPEQAFVVNFSDIQWLNYKGRSEPREITTEPAKLERGKSSGTSKAFVLTWFAPATSVSDDQCPALNAKPTEADYYAAMSKEDADKERAALASKGGVAANVISFRGPDKLNVCLLPGIVPDPGFVAPQGKTARGFNLDGDDGADTPPASTRKHVNYVSEDGPAGIDNQLFTVEGCIGGFQRRGIIPMVLNESRRSGLLSVLVVISGIDDERNDDNVDVTLLYSKDPMAKDASGKSILPYYTFRVSDRPEFTQSFARLHGRIVNGVVTTEPVAQLQIQEGRGSATTFANARMRIEFLPDGTMKGIIGGYLDWRRFMNIITAYTASAANWETGVGFQCPGVYNAVRRAADGLKDPVTGEFNGISAAYDIEGAPAFIPPDQRKALVAQSETRSR